MRLERISWPRRSRSRRSSIYLAHLHAAQTPHVRSPRSSAPCPARCRRSSAGRRRTGASRSAGAALFAIVFFWQIPHFMAIAWMYRDDYAQAGFPMLPVIDPTGRRAGRQAVMYAAALLPMSAVPALVGLSGNVYLAVALVLGTVLCWLAVRFAVGARRTMRRATCSSDRSPTCRFSGSR